ncbi:MAG: GatB/YqeY domain-containing protein [Candidatus Omnitrophica bacterium]|nr:GatB/YqeY domain-containing protein [Candidatus Omnitrophota bacterium]
MSIVDQIEKDIINAMKAKDTVKVSTLRMLKSALTNYLIQAKKDKAEDADVLAVLAKQAKQRRESIDSFEKANRGDLVNKEKAELAVLEAYLPQQLTDEALRGEVQKAITASGAATAGDIGKLMKVLMPAIQGKADGKRVQEMVRSLLK